MHNSYLSRVGFTLIASAITLIPTSLAIGQTAPPEPSVRPIVSRHPELDLNANRIDDRFELQGGQIARLLATGQIKSATALQDVMLETYPVELIFDRQVTQAQIDQFLQMGGVIDHVFRHVSYGWTGRIPFISIPSLPAAMGARLIGVFSQSVMVRHLDEATRSSRVRTVWQPGFAGFASGYRGSSDTTIAIVDTGIDDSHRDLAGRMAYWKDWTADNIPSPRDRGEHGTHVAGIALGTGAAFELNTSQLSFTDSGSLDFVPANSFNVSPMHLPVSPFNVSLSATWTGGGQSQVHLLRELEPNGGWLDIGGSTAGPNPRATFIPNIALTTGSHYSTALISNGQNNINFYRIAGAITYAPVGDGFPSFSGAAPGTMWAGFKVFPEIGKGSSIDLGKAIDDIVANRVEKHIKIANFSLGIETNGGIDSSIRDKINTLALNGVLPVVSSGNGGPTVPVSDPGRAALALTVSASNDLNQLTAYSSSGFLNPAANEDFKPDILAPGGSTLRSFILSADSNDSDAGVTTVGDAQPNDYKNAYGTSMAAPMVSGIAALLVQAMEGSGTVWSYSSGQHPAFVKMMLCASATETNTARESGTGNPALGRAAAPKDFYEGYGVVNADAAIEAITVPLGTDVTVLQKGTTDGSRFDRRAWGRNLTVTAGSPVKFWLNVPTTADYDLYVYSSTPDAKGNPVILASSTSSNLGASELVSFTPTYTGRAYLFIKWVSGNGQWEIYPEIPKPSLLRLEPASGGAGGPGFTLTVKGSNFHTSSVLYWNGSPRTTTVVSSTTISAAITAADIATAGGYRVYVKSSGGDSNTLIYVAGTTTLSVTSNSVVRQSGVVKVTLLVKNTGTATAASCQVSAASMQRLAEATRISALTVPVNIGSIAPGATAQAVVDFAGSIGSSGSLVMFRATVSHGTGSVSHSRTVSLP